MAQVTITSCKDSGKKWKDKPIYEVVLADGRKGSCFDEGLMKLAIGTPVELDIKEGKPYNGQPQYIINLPKAAGSKGFAPKDYTSDKRMCALTNAVNSIKQIEGKITTEAILALAGKYVEFLNAK